MTRPREIPTSIDGGDLAVGIGQRIDQQAQRRGQLPDEQRARLWLGGRPLVRRPWASSGRRSQQIIRSAFLDELVGERRRQRDGFFRIGRNRLRDRPVRQQGEPHFDIEDFEPLWNNSSDQQREQRDRHFRAGGASKSCARSCP